MAGGTGDGPTNHGSQWSDRLIEHTDLATDDRTDRVGHVVSEIEGRGLHSIRLAFADVHGVLRGKTIRADLVADAFTDGVGITSALLMKDTGQNNVYPVWAAGGGLDQPWMTGAGDMMMVPDPSTFRVLPWAAGTGWLLCDLVTPDGAAIEFSTRRLCAMLDREMRSTGRRLVAGLEVEFHLFHREAGSGSTAPNSTTPTGPRSAHLSPIHPGWMYLGENRFDTIEPLLEPLRSNLTALGLPPRSLEIELGPGQVEMTFSPGGALEVADQALLLRAAVNQIARRHGLLATFMSRPHVPGSFTSGWHLHQSLVDGDDGTNLFALPPGAPSGAPSGAPLGPTSGSPLADSGRHYLAGLLGNAAESCLLTTPTVTGYKRYRADSLAPLRASWGSQNRGAMLRIIGRSGDPATRIENRVGDPAANPYLYLTSQMVSGRLGLDAKEEPPPSADSPYGEEAGPRLPTYLGQAIDRFDGSAVYRTALGDPFVDYLVGIKRAEWNRFLSTVTDWEHEEYMELF